MRTTPRRRRRNEINIVPLVDVLVVLIFFFLIMMEFRTQTVLAITPPAVESAGESEQVERLVVGVDAEGNFYYNGEEVTRADLADLLKTASQLQPDEPVLVQADEEAPWRDVAYIMDECRKCGLDNITVQTRGGGDGG
ncbi:MAG: ExbD/TolR family protein [Opitutales bacterium]